VVLLFAVLFQTLIIASAINLLLKFATHQVTTMPDILYLLASIGFFALMLVFIRACEKV
jgi:hypothetical protein